MTEETTIERVRRVMAEYFGAPEAVPHDHTADLGIDSLDQIEIGIALEDEFGLEAIADEDMWGCNTIHEWVELVENMLAGKVGA